MNLPQKLANGLAWLLDVVLLPMLAWLERREIAKHNREVAKRSHQLKRAILRDKGWRSWSVARRLWCVLTHNVEDAWWWWTSSAHYVIKNGQSEEWIWPLSWRNLLP